MQHAPGGQQYCNNLYTNYNKCIQCELDDTNTVKNKSATQHRTGMVVVHRQLYRVNHMTGGGGVVVMLVG